jgi:hypothetical protein
MNEWDVVFHSSRQTRTVNRVTGSVAPVLPDDVTGANECVQLLLSDKPIAVESAASDFEPLKHPVAGTEGF